MSIDGVAARALPRLVGSRTPGELDAIELVLREAPIVPGSAGFIGGRNSNGAIETFRLADGAGGMPVVRKLADQQAAQERFAWGFARLLGIDHLVAEVGVRPDASVMERLVPGTIFDKAGIAGPADIEASLTRWHVATHGMAQPAAAKQARIERQLMQVFDYIPADGDRHGRNGLVDAAGAVKLIDQGRLASGERPFSVLRPHLNDLILDPTGATRHIALDPETVAHIRARVTPQAIAALHEQTLAHEPIRSLHPPKLVLRNRVHSQWFRARMQQRLQHVLDTGGFSYSPLTWHHRRVGL